MPQQTNLNVAPYFDDFDATNDYHKVLFKPGFPVQARELTTLQSILQNQIEKFGQHFFKEGAKVIPGNTGYSQTYYCVQLENVYQGVPVSAYADQLIGTKITGQTSGVTAFVDSILFPEDSERGNLTLYVNYLNSSTSNNSTQIFSDGESLICNQSLSSGLLGNTTIAPGTPLATTLTAAAAATGSSFQIENGIYFIRGNFVNVNKEVLILDQYTTSPNYRIGLLIEESVITSDIDEELNDNSQGFNNYAAPGADRLRISVRLTKKALDDFNDNNFVLLATVINGVLQTESKKTYATGGVGYKDLTDVLARRTFDESGNYYVHPFEVSVVNSLNDRVGNGGIFNAGQFSPGGVTVSEDLALYKISPGKAYVKGYEIETTNAVYLDVDKPRTSKTLEDQNIIYNTGPTLKLNKIYRNPIVGLGNTYILSLRDQRVGVNSETAPGNEVGVARVYDFRLESGSYNTSDGNLNEWNLALYDVQTNVNISLNESHTLSTPTFIKGASSGATGFLRYNVNDGTELTVYETEGSFLINEKLIFNGIDNGRIAIAVTEHGISDIKSVYGMNGYHGDPSTVGINTFSADVIQSTKFTVGIATISPLSGGVSTVRSNNTLFPGTLVKENDLIEYTDNTTTGLLTEDPIIARVVSVGATHINIESITAVAGICSSLLPTASLNVTDFKVLTTQLSSSSDDSLFTTLPKINISDVSLDNASLSIRKTFDVTIASNELSTQIVAGTNETFLPFNKERYLLIRDDGITEALDTSKLNISSDGKTLQIRGLGSNGGATLIATLKKIKPKAKQKIKNRVNSIIVDKSKLVGSGIGTTTLNNGLTHGSFPFGTRVEDEVISLNTPDVIQIHGIYESTDISEASCPQVTLQLINTVSTTTQELLIGERFVGQTSGSVGMVAEKLNSSSVSFIYKNEIAFIEGETVEFEESLASALVSSVETPSFNISSNYTFQTGQEKTIYDYGRIRRKSGSAAPDKQLKIYFTNASYSTIDDGDITTVNSYNQFDYAKEIKSVNSLRNTDIIDIRPRVSNFITANTNTRSPLEFFGRSYDGSGQNATNTLASNEAILANISYFQGRIDRVFLSKDGKFQIVYGTPSDNPTRPDPVDDALEVCTVTLPPYLYDTSQAVLSFMEHKRYQMQDIKRLERRIKSLEYYTTLSLLEKETANLFISDNSGLNRFKAGFFVDNFNDFQAQENNVRINNSIDRKFKELRPRHYTTSVDLVTGPVVDIDPTVDPNFATIEGNNVRKENDVITLDYSEVEFVKQTFATRTESVTPFLISFWSGTIELSPASDTWVDPVRLDARVLEIEGNYNEVFNAQVDAGVAIDPQTGLGPVVWDVWVDNWTGTNRTPDTVSRIVATEPNVVNVGGGGRQRTSTRTVWDEVWEDQVNVLTDVGTQTRSGIRTIIHEEFETQSMGDRVVSRDVVPYMRSRNIEFVSKRMKPLTRMYAFFDGVDITEYCIPKLLEITMTSGTFQVGETVIGEMQTIGLGQVTSSVNPSIKFRVAQHNHREGPYNAPSKTYTQNPYLNVDLSTSYSSTSTILNVDTFSLASSDPSKGDFQGWVKQGMVLVGQTSGAIATIENVRLISDLSSTLIGCYYIPDPNNLTFPRFETGTKTFTLTNDPDNDQNIATTIAEESFSASGVIETVQENIISIRNGRVELRPESETQDISRDAGTEIVNSTFIGQQSRTQTVIEWYDPLAQSFFVEDETGVFLTSCDVFFRSKDDMDIPVVFQLRTMINGSPSTKIIPFSEVVLDPNDVQTSADGSVATNIRFKAPVYVEGGNEYAMCLVSNSTKYSVYISRIGENDLLTDTFISNQPYLGSLFKSQNASTWEPSQWEDLKFTLYRADFIENGSVEFYSPELTKGNAQIAKLTPNPISLESRSIRVGLGTTVADDTYEFGNTFFQQGTNATGDLVGVAGSAVGDLSISNAGIGYTPADGSYTFTGVNLVTLTGNGRGATADITVNNGSIVASGATINLDSAGGSGYQVGDVVGINTIGAASVGRNARLTIAGIGHTNELILNNVQGEFVVGAAKTLSFFNSSGISAELNYSHGGDVQIANIITDSDGLHFKVNHQNHGMYFSDNSVNISGVLPDIKPTKLTAEYSSTSTGQIVVGAAAAFSTFEGVGVGTTNPGYVMIGDEIVEYTNVTGNSIGGDIVRGVNPKTYPVGTPVYKYELGGINLNRINRTHALSEVTKLDPFTFDSYQVKIDTSSTTGTDRSTDVGFPKLYITGDRSTGGISVRASQNIPFEIVTPQVQNVTVPGTNITAELRTTTSQSFSGTETPYRDAGFEDITINQKNYFDTPRMIASKVNEDDQLIDVPGNKSMQMRLFLNTIDTRISPVVDAQRVNAILTSNRVNNVISNYATDSRVNSVSEDPTAFQYLSKEIILENPASSIKVIVAAHVNEGSDIRAFFATNNKPGLNPIFTPFPGYTNLNGRGEVIASENNNGEPDSFITKSNTLAFDSRQLPYREYTFTIDRLPSFKTYRIKLNLTSNNQCFVPRLKELRVIALA